VDKPTVVGWGGLDILAKENFFKIRAYYGPSAGWTGVHRPSLFTSFYLILIIRAL